MQLSSPLEIVNRLLVSLGVKPSYVINLDSATFGLKAITQFLQEKELSAGGPFPEVSGAFLNGISHLPHHLTDKVSTLSGWLNASSPSALESVREEIMSEWVVKQYPKRRYPAMMIGSSNGAAVHLCSALGIPWLPQTLLVCIRHSVDLDRPIEETIWSKEPIQTLLKNNPHLWAYQMHDPNQDRLKVGQVSYFRLKRSALGEAYKKFILETLEPGGTLFLLECCYSWLATRVGDRHVFQFGGMGTLEPSEYFRETPEITDFLHQQHSRHQTWHPPEPDGWYPESEWGFEPALREDVERFAHEHGLRVRRIVFQAPQDLSALVADLYRWWYDTLGRTNNRLFVESFTYLHPYLAFKKGLIPYWSVFNDQTSLQRVKAFLEETKPYDEIYVNLFSNGLYSLGIAPIEEWRSLFQLARQHGEFVGVNEETYPGDLASFVRHYTALKKLEGNYPMPESLTLQQLDTFLEKAGDRYNVQF